MKLRVLVAAAAALVLAGCGSVHPGAAVVVGDTTISMDRADDIAEVYCLLAVRSSQPGAPVSNADVRRQAVIDLALGVVAREIAAEKNLEPNPSDYELTGAQRAQVAGAFPGGQVDDIIDALGASQRTFAIARLLGEESLGPDAGPDADPERAQNAGLELIQDEVARRDVQFDPRFGIGSDGRQTARTGSLSVPVEAPGQPDQKGLPATQQCSG